MKFAVTEDKQGQAAMRGKRWLFDKDVEPRLFG